MKTRPTAPPAPDLEETAELPQLAPAPDAALDPLSNTDAWKSPAAADTETQALPTLSQPRSRGLHQATEAAVSSRHEAELGALRSDLASVSESRSQLERDLQILGGNLRELEQLLNRKSEQLSLYEREVGLRDRRIGELEARIGEQDAALAAQRTQYDRELAETQGRLDSERNAAGSERYGLQRELSEARSHSDALQKRGQQLAAELAGLKAETAGLARRCHGAEFDLAQWRARGARYQESLQSQEGRRQLFDGEIAARDARIDALESARSERERLSEASEEELRNVLRAQEQRLGELEAARGLLQSAAEAARQRVAALEQENRSRGEALRGQQARAQAREQELETALGAQRERAMGLEAAHGEAQADAGAAHQRIGALQAEAERAGAAAAERQAQAQRREQELETEHGAQRRRPDELEAAQERAQQEAAVARERIAGLEAEAQSQSQAVRELQQQLQAVRDSLAQRNALIERVGAEAASSVATLGNIQHNLEHLGAEEEAHRLSRSDGATGIVHLLGRRTTIGRTPDNDLHIDADFISRHHAVALRTGNRTVIEDLNSTNGTYVNGQRVNRRTLRDGDLVTLGTTEFRFSTGKPPG